ncbi:HAD-IIIC family phosphatase [Nocardia uniformis]|uniref:HAD-IIIC family phosphatase n=1 Tax=Nocardia uniformis TaxID=53432 RepID=A0A849BZS3_9NOCA|nr:HAD-IIIC family phosphatase [Nocardia uniformis]NNH69585.1 HAD-IIIC family phosphatase [Nocardia uniformis]
MTTVKCLVWDLDDTVWPGVVLESDGGSPKPEALHAIRTLDERGILHAVASRGEAAAATSHLRAHGIEDMFSAIEVSWGPKSEAIRRIADFLNIGRDTIAFVDNDPAELAEVATAFPEVRCYSADRIAELSDLPEFAPAAATSEARQRRSLYRAERERVASQAEFSGSDADFLASLDLVMTVREATEADLVRAHELTERTHQLNTTGATFDLDELRALCASPRHAVLVASLTDRFGGYGTIGLAVTEERGSDSVLLLLLMSCRVMSRGVGTAFIAEVVRRAHAADLRPAAEFVATSLNRVMLVTLRFAGFEVVETAGDRVLLACSVPAENISGTGHVEVVR